MSLPIPLQNIYFSCTNCHSCGAQCLNNFFSYHTHRYVQLSNPYLNILIVIGAIMFYVVVILFGVDENTASFDTVDSLCHTRIWLCAFAFTLLCGTIIAKTYKIYHIFRHTKPNSTPVSGINFPPLILCHCFIYRRSILFTCF